MADIQKVQRLGDVDMVGDERRTWYVVEWKDDQRNSRSFVGESGAQCAKIIEGLNVAVSDIVQYCILSTAETDRMEVIEYIVSGNSRLDWFLS